MSINLLAWREQKQQILQKNIQRAIWLTSVIALISLIGLRYGVQYHNQQNVRRNQALKQAIQQLNYTPVIEKHYEKLMQLKQIIALQRAVQHQQEKQFQLFAELGEAMPNALRLTDVHLDYQQLHLTGSALSADDVTQYVKHLSSQPDFSKVTLEKIEKKDRVNTFQIEAQIKNAPP